MSHFYEVQQSILWLQCWVICHIHVYFAISNDFESVNWVRSLTCREWFSTLFYKCTCSCWAVEYIELIYLQIANPGGKTCEVYR